MGNVDESVVANDNGEPVNKGKNTVNEVVVLLLGKVIMEMLNIERIWRITSLVIRIIRWQVWVTILIRAVRVVM